MRDHDFQRNGDQPPRYFVPHQHFSREARHYLRGHLHSDLNVESVVTAIRRLRKCSYSEYQLRVPSLRLSNSPDLRCACLDASPGQVTTTASDDEFSMPSNTARCTRSSLPIPESVCCLFVHAVCATVSFRRCRCGACHQVRSEFHQPTEHPCIKWGSECDAPQQPSVI